ncbi:MAG: hypothetical protein RLZZ399_1091 [Verrucomicrobiota bacterium]|jgi:lysophospholipid acyltransferase (LPLAT)-like uncharacterized protein
MGRRLMMLLGGTLRWKLEDEAGYLSRPLDQPLLVAVWHNRILALPLCYQWMCKARRPLSVLTSPSRDGGLLSALVAQFGIGAVRGSSSRRGSAALRELQTVLKSGRDVIITPDGPRGPRYQLQPGLVFLAQLTGTPIMAVQVEYSAYWELRSWDRFRIPKPFSSVRIRFLPLLTVGRGQGEDGAVGPESEGVRVAALLGGD